MTVATALLPLMPHEGETGRFPFWCLHSAYTAEDDFIKLPAKPLLLLERATRFELATLSLGSSSKQTTLPIRLMQTPAPCRVRPFAGVEHGAGRHLRAARKAMERSERVKPIEVPIEAEQPVHGPAFAGLNSGGEPPRV